MSAVQTIPSSRVIVLFLVMLVAAAGNTAMQSALPAIASELDMPDVWVSLAFSWSALLWVITAPKWARLSDRRGRKQLMSVGVIGFAASMGLCGLVLWLGLAGLIGPGSARVVATEQLNQSRGHLLGGPTGPLAF